MITKETLEGIAIKIRLEYMYMVKNMDTSSLSYDANDTVTLYHGTTTGYLNQIIRNGILPRKETGIGNWENEVASIENVTYLTNKWHYAYAMNAHMLHLQNEHGDDPTKITALTSFPCYIECKVPKDLLVADEDYLLSSYFQQKIKYYMKKNPKSPYTELFDLIDPMECLTQYGTVGVLGSISPSMFVSFTVLGEQNLYQYLLDDSSPYIKDWNKWKQGKGKGKIKLKTLWEKEAESNLNGTWHISQVKKGKIVSFGLNEATRKLAMVQR